MKDFININKNLNVNEDVLNILNLYFHFNLLINIIINKIISNLDKLIIDNLSI